MVNTVFDILRLKPGEFCMSKRGIFATVMALIAVISTICCGQVGAGTAQHTGIDPALLAKASAGNAAAEFRVGAQYELGAHVQKDLAKAAEWYLKAADKGYPQAQHSLGVLYELGYGVRDDDATAAGC